MKFHETVIWKAVVACKDLEGYKRNEIAGKLQAVIDNPECNFSDKDLLGAFIWEESGDWRYWDKLSFILHNMDREEW